MEFALDRTFLFHTLQELVRIDSVNPSIDPRGGGEQRIALHIAEALRNMGIEVNLLESTRGRPSVVGKIAGRGSGKSLTFNAHMDTVGVEGMVEPFAAAVRNGRLYGRGAYDMKGSIAAMLAAAKALVEGDTALNGDLILAFVADEEYESLGTREVLRHYRTDAAIVTEPTQLQICLAHKGFIWFEVTTHGRAAHGSRFDEGIDANMRMGRVLRELEKIEKALRNRKGHPLVGPPSLHAALLRGGTGLSTYADRCVLNIERRTIPGEKAEAVQQSIEKILQRLKERDPHFTAELRTLCVREPFEVRPDAAIVKTVADSAARVLGRQPAFIGDTPWMDAALYAAAGIETVVIGPAGAGAHSLEEWVDIDSVEKLAAILVHSAVAYCQ